MTPNGFIIIKKKLENLGIKRIGVAPTPNGKSAVVIYNDTESHIVWPSEEELYQDCLSVFKYMKEKCNPLNNINYGTLFSKRGWR